MMLSEFLLARIAEDEAVAIAYRDGDWWGNPYSGDGDGSDVAWADRITPDRVRRECEARRRIVEEHGVKGDARLCCTTCWDWVPMAYADWPCPTIRALAAVYADHPDYRREWA